MQQDEMMWKNTEKENIIIKREPKSLICGAETSCIRLLFV